MRYWGRVVVGAFVVTMLSILLAPRSVLWTIETVRWLAAGLAGAGQQIPLWVLVAGILVLVIVLSFLVIFGILRLFTSVGTAGGSRLTRWYDRLTPDSAQAKALGLMAVFALVLFVGLAVFVPWLGTSLGESTGIDDVVTDIQPGQDGQDIEVLFADDGFRRGNGTDIPQTDTDGDRLPDEWERTGESSRGASLADANPDRMDLYVQLNYGANVSRLSQAERQQLRDVWAEMPVSNPDNMTGIDLHLVDQGDRAGDLNEAVSIGGQSALDRYYTEQRLGDRFCTYHQVTLGGSRDVEAIGYAETPGYASVFEGATYEAYDGNVSFRVATITHLLLHNVVGETDGGVHSTGGWLAYPAAENERLSESVAQQLQDDGFVTSSFDRERCSSVTDGTS